MSPVGVDNVDGTPCPAGVSCASGLCGAGGLCLPRYLWSRPLPQGGCVGSMAVSPDGNLVVLGGYLSTDPLASGMGFIEKVDPDLNVIWRHTLGGFSGTIIRPTVLADGTIIFAVNGAPTSFDSGMIFSRTSADIQTELVAISAAGSYQWFKFYPTPPNADGTDQIGIQVVTANPGGGMTIAGGFHGRVTFDFEGVAPPIGTRGDSTTSAFVAQYDAAGKFGWANAYPSSKGAAVGFGGTTSFLGVAPDGGIYVAGGFDGTGVFGTTAQDPVLPTQFVAHLDPTGSITATGSWVANPPGLPPALALAKDGSLFQASDVDFRRVAPTTGEAVWSSPTPTWFQFRMAAATNVTVAGEFLMPTDFDFGAGQALLQPQGNFLASYTPGGQLLWVRHLNVATNSGVIIGLDGSLYYLNILVLPRTDFDPGPAVDAIQVSNYDCLITKFAP